MSDKTYTEREVVERERRAYRDGVSDAVRGASRSPDWVETADGMTRSIESAVRYLYPLPTITRPRVVKDVVLGGGEWRVVGGVLEYRTGQNEPWQRTGVGEWIRGDILVFAPTAERVTLWSSLLASPTETVDQ